LYLQVTPGYFATMGMALLRGRDVSWRDDSTVKATVISRAMAERIWPGQDPVGRHFSFGPGQRLVVGVVADVRTTRLEEEAEPAMYFPITELTSNDVTIVARGTLTPDVMTRRIRDAVRTVDPSQAVYNARSMDAVVAQSIRRARFTVLLVGAFALSALLLGAIGIYGVMSYLVGQRTQEMGIRLALGATVSAVIGLVVGRAAKLAVIGVVAGLIAALFATRWLGALLYDVSPTDPVTFLAVPLLFVMVAMLASYAPARRATRIDPVRALKAE
jgi:predicted permease